MRQAGTLLLGAVALLAGCGSSGTPTRTLIDSGALRIYSGLPLHGARAGDGRAVLRGERLALEQVSGRVGGRTVELVPLDDTDPATGDWEPGQVAANARRAAQDPDTVAYVGDLASSATAVSVPITNAVGILQVSPLSGYTGLTQPADKGEPDKYYPTGHRTFARLVPSGHVEATALAGWIHDLGLTRVALAYDELQDGLGQGGELQRALVKRGITIADMVRVDPRDDEGHLADDARDVMRVAAPAVVYAGASTRSALGLLQAVHDRDPSLDLFATSGVAGVPLASQLRAAAPQVRLTSPLIPAAAGSAEARRVGGRYAMRYGAPAPPAALYGYEAMRGILAALRRAGAGAADRGELVRAYFATRVQASVLGPYAIDAHGDTTASRFGGFSVRDGRLRLAQVLEGQD